jgi:hypothetical protein
MRVMREGGLDVVDVIVFTAFVGVILWLASRLGSDPPTPRDRWY